jgi:hypothetical protein
MASAVASPRPFAAVEPHPCTLLELVRVLTEITDDEREVVATVLHMLSTGSVRLIGNFKNAKPEDWA